MAFERRTCRRLVYVAFPVKSIMNKRGRMFYVQKPFTLPTTCLVRRAMLKLFGYEKGFSLTEGLLAQAILFIVMVAILSVFIMGMRFNAESEDVTVATNIAQQRMEEIMNTRYRYIVAENPPGVTLFSSAPSYAPYWVKNSNSQWVTALPQGKYEISYPDGLDADPLRIKITISWFGKNNVTNSLSLETLVSMTPGRFRSS